MFLPLLVLSSYLLLLIDPARAQATAPSCTVVSFSWSYNSLQQNPCLVAAYLLAACNAGTFNVPALQPQNSYTGPSGLDDGDPCKCNTVAYNLISACDACQGSSSIAYSEWIYNCTSAALASPGTFPEPIPAGTRVPKWAYVDSSAADSWNQTEAAAIGDTPEVTGTASIVPTTILASHSTVTPSATSSSSSIPTSHSSSSNAGAIAGGVVGGLIGAAVIAAGVAWFVIRRRRARAPSAAYMSGQGGDMGEPVPYPLTVETPRVYDPEDPSTFPTTYPHSPSSPTIYTTNQSAQYHSPSSDLQPNRQAYSGLPEV